MSCVAADATSEDDDSGEKLHCFHFPRWSVGGRLVGCCWIMTQLVGWTMEWEVISSSAQTASPEAAFGPLFLLQAMWRLFTWLIGTCIGIRKVSVFCDVNGKVHPFRWDFQAKTFNCLSMYSIVQGFIALLYKLFTILFKYHMAYSLDTFNALFFRFTFTNNKWFISIQPQDVFSRVKIYH